MSKSILAICLAVALVFTASIVSADPTTVIHTWNGSGTMGIDFQAGDDAHHVFNMGGNFINGTFTGIDRNDNPYGYGVDTVTSQLKANFAGGGEMELTVDREDSKESSYGVPGENTYSYVGSDDTGEMALYHWTNYANLRSPNYGHDTTTNGKQFEATGTYLVLHQLETNDGDGANLSSTGTGSTLINVMCNDTWNGSFRFGNGCGCYTDADVEATGTGVFALNAWGDNGLSIRSPGWFVPGDGSDNSAKFNATFNYAGATGVDPFVIDDFSISGS